MIFSTSYQPDVCDFITTFVRVVNPGSVIEIGAQQGRSAVAITKGMTEGSTFDTFDLFEDSYRGPPYLPTHASKVLVKRNLCYADVRCQWGVWQGDHKLALEKVTTPIDFLHLDICNHKENVEPILRDFHKLVMKAMVLEGGIYNRWQKEYNYKPWHLLLKEKWLEDWSHITLSFNNHNAITIMVKKDL